MAPSLTSSAPDSSKTCSQIQEIFNNAHKNPSGLAIHMTFGMMS
jgi:hypothetical protein